jgi:hypothetical protein
MTHAEIALLHGSDEYTHRTFEAPDVKQVKRNSIFAGKDAPVISNTTKQRKSSFVVHTAEGEGGAERKKSMTHAEIALLHGSDEYTHRTFEAPDVKQVKRNSIFAGKAENNPLTTDPGEQKQVQRAGPPHRQPQQRGDPGTREAMQ